MIESILVVVLIVDIFALGWLANLSPPDSHTDGCCIGMPDIPDTPDELLTLAKRDS
jgi:hypothetical protein